MYDSRKMWAQAESHVRRSTEIYKKIFGRSHPEVANGLIYLSQLISQQNRNTEAEKLAKEAIAIYEDKYPATNPQIIEAHNYLGNIYVQQNQSSNALKSFRRSSEGYFKRMLQTKSFDVTTREFAKKYGHSDMYLILLAQNPLGESQAKIADESFKVAQLSRFTNTADSVVKMSARVARGNDEITHMVREQQDAELRRQRAETQLLEVLKGRSVDQDADGKQKLREKIASEENSIRLISDQIGRRFPEYQELVSPNPLSVDGVRALLGQDEAMLTYTVLEQAVFMWVVRPEGAQFILTLVKKEHIRKAIDSIREQLEVDAGQEVPRIDVRVLHALYADLFSPAIPYLDGVRHLLVVPDGDLQSIPFSMFVKSPPPNITKDADYREVDWLARHYAISVLPAVGSIKALRGLGKRRHATEPFAGFGDPLIGEEYGNSRRKGAKVDISTLFRSSKNLSGKSGHTIEAIADVETIRSMYRLPEAADELRQIGKTLGAGPESIWLQQSATESVVKKLDLSRYQTLAFATHGVMAGEIDGVGEPGLIMTPPRQGTTDDDGYLAASEIAVLNLNADLTILSACNTAAADGSRGAEGLSGLAKAFFYAGSHSLLVSHWPVASQATVMLTTRMLEEYKADPKQGIAQAHRKSMLALMNSSAQPELANPFFWAPFVVVGEGAR